MFRADARKPSRGSNKTLGLESDGSCDYAALVQSSSRDFEYRCVIVNSVRRACSGTHSGSLCSACPAMAAWGASVLTVDRSLLRFAGFCRSVPGGQAEARRGLAPADTCGTTSPGSWLSCGHHLDWFRAHTFWCPAVALQTGPQQSACHQSRLTTASSSHATRARLAKAMRLCSRLMRGVMR